MILDEFAPYLWQGASACADWANDFDADAKRNGITDGFVKLSKAVTLQKGAAGWKMTGWAWATGKVK